MARTTALRRSKDDLAAASRRTPLLTFALDFHRKESVCGGHGPSLTGSLLSRLASAGFGRWRRDVAPARLRGVWHVKEQTCAVHQTARWFQNPIVIVAVMRKMITPQPQGNIVPAPEKEILPHFCSG